MKTSRFQHQQQSGATRASYPMQQQQKGLFSKPKAPAPAPAPAPTPPVTQSAAEVVQAKNQTRTDAAKRRGQAATLLAGETGGVQDQSAMKTLLGS